MALFKVTVVAVTTTTGIIEANSKEEITSELEKIQYPVWWAQHTSETTSLTASDIAELEEKAE